MGSTKLKIGMVVAVHFVAGLVLAWVDSEGMWPDPTSCGLLGLIYATAQDWRTPAGAA